jgi:hypothetical protein
VLPTVLRKEPVATMPFTSGRAIVGVSPSGQYVSCCWPAGRRYSVWYRTLTGGWQEVDTGLAVDLAWHSHRRGARRLSGPALCVGAARPCGLVRQGCPQADRGR